MRFAMTAATLLVFVNSDPASAQFFGPIAFSNESCPEPGERRLAERLEYIDSYGTGWVAESGNCTDGASIPGIFHRIIGAPFDGDLISAAVIHDHYCDRRVRNWPQTHWVFYDALRTSGVSRRRALTMYFAVMAAGPKWITLTDPIPCNNGQNCLMQVPATDLPQGFRRAVTEDGARVAIRAPRYDDPDFLAALNMIEAEVAGLDDVEDWTEQNEEDALAQMHLSAIAFLGNNDPAVRFAIEGLVFAPQGPVPATE